MKLYTGRGPNPKAARWALAEKGIDYERIEIDILKNESRTGEFAARINPAGTIPALETEEGQCISEIGAIAEYLEEIAPEPPLIGRNAQERAETRMWARRLDLDICIIMGIGFQSGPMRAMFEPRKELPPADVSPRFVEIAHKRLEWLEGQMAGRTWICGDRFSWADIPLYCYLDFFGRYGTQTAPAGGWLDGWRARMKARPASAA